MENKKIPLCVDLDGTLIATDILYESALLLIKKNFLFIFLLPIWLMKGRLHLKHKLFEYVCPNPEFLPYRQEVIKYIEEEKFKGRKIILVTATLQQIAEKIAEYMFIFDDIIGSDNEVNLVGKAKKERLISIYGEGNFDYIGDSSKDIYIWQSSRNAIVVNPSKEIKNSINNIEKTFVYEVSIPKLIVKEIRVYQWIKNLLIFFPILLAHSTIIGDYIKLIYAFFAFSFIASAVYVLNDLMDLESDRAHPRKRNRPFASGKLPILFSFILIPGLFFGSLLISFLALPIEFIIVLFIYFTITTAYSFLLKKIYVMDIITLAVLYTIRLVAGAVTAEIPISPWFLSFSVFIFFSLAVLKRYTELLTLKELNKKQTSGRDYFVDDIQLLNSLGTSSGLISVLIFALYLNSPEVTQLYNNPIILYSIIPFLMYWVTRIWFKAHRGQMHDDPIVFTGKDPASYIIFFIIALIIVGATI